MSLATGCVATGLVAAAAAPTPRLPSSPSSSTAAALLPSAPSSSTGAALLPSAPSSSAGKNVYSIRGKTFVTDPRYEVSKRLGQGAYGLLAAAHDRATGETVAIKKISRAFDDLAASKRTLREVRLLRHFKHENVLSLLDIMTPPVDSPWSDVYLVFEKMDTDLHYIIHSAQPLSGAHTQWLIYQTLRGLKAIHSARAMHRDLKPSNLLVNRNSDLKICDFGLARGLDASRSPPRPRGAHLADEPELSPLTEYVVTRWYRAPELLLGNHTYDHSVDVWSVGCILAECLSRTVLFRGKDYLHQTRLVVAALDVPAEAVERLVDHPAAAAYVRGLPRVPTGSAPAARMPLDTEPAALELLTQLLAFDPSERPSASDALGHAFFESVASLNDAPSAPPFDFDDFEGAQGVSEADVRRLVWDEMRGFHPEVGGERSLSAALSARGRGI